MAEQYPEVLEWKKNKGRYFKEDAKSFVEITASYDHNMTEVKSKITELKWIHMALSIEDMFLGPNSNQLNPCYKRGFEHLRTVFERQYTSWKAKLKRNTVASEVEPLAWEVTHWQDLDRSLKYITKDVFRSDRS